MGDVWTTRTDVKGVAGNVEAYDDAGERVSQFLCRVVAYDIHLALHSFSIASSSLSVAVSLSTHESAMRECNDGFWFE